MPVTRPLTVAIVVDAEPLLPEQPNRANSMTTKTMTANLDGAKRPALFTDSINIIKTWE
jgi:hypothetical protein